MLVSIHNSLRIAICNAINVDGESVYTNNDVSGVDHYADDGADEGLNDDVLGDDAGMSFTW